MPMPKVWVSVPVGSSANFDQIELEINDDTNIADFRKAILAAFKKTLEAYAKADLQLTTHDDIKLEPEMLLKEIFTEESSYGKTKITAIKVLTSMF